MTPVALLGHRMARRELCVQTKAPVSTARHPQRRVTFLVSVTQGTMDVCVKTVSDGSLFRARC